MLQKNIIVNFAGIFDYTDMKTVLKMLAGLIAGGLLGVVIGGIIVVAFTDTSLGEYLAKFGKIGIGEGVMVFLVAIVSLCISILILIPVHELGHLICGLLSGYKFVSFRILNWTFIKEGGKIRIKRFAVAGTGGQCLMTPPDRPLDEIPVNLYNAGGIIANLIVLLIVLPFFFLKLNPFVAEALGIFAMTDFIMLLMNGIPMQAGGLGNDAYNMLQLKKNTLSRLGIFNQLSANALIQQGVRPKDMPDRYFFRPDVINYRNALEVSIPLMYAGRLLDNGKYEEALAEMEDLYRHKEEIMPLYVKEIACELAFLYLHFGMLEQAGEILDKDLRKYVETYSKVMTSKVRLLFAIALYLDNDREKAMAMLNDLRNRRNDFLLQGEVESDIALMEAETGEPESQS